MRLAASVVAAVLLLGAPAPGQEVPTLQACQAELERAAAKVRASAPTDRPKALEELQRRCAELIDHHGKAAPGDVLFKAAGGWFFAAQQLRTPEDVQRQRLAQVRGLPNITPALDQYLREMHARLNLRPGAPAPDWSAVDLRDGARVTLSSFKGKLVLVDFWISWCPSCRALAKDRLAPLFEKYGEDPRFALVGLGMPWDGDTAEKQKKLAEEQGWRWQKVFDATADSAASYAVTEPSLVLVDEEGKVLVLGSLAVMDQVERVITERLGPARR